MAMKKYILLLPLLVITLFFMGGSVNAAEITPEADSYTLGSTSEMSASSTYDEERTEDSDSGSLADTGETATYIIVGAIALIIIGGFVARRTLAKK